MPSLRPLLLGLAVTASLVTLAAAEPPSNHDDVERDQDAAAFARLLAQADPPALHAALHDLTPDKYAHGAFHEDHHAAEQIHREDPPLALSIVSLARRQESNISTPTTPDPPPQTSVVVISPSDNPTTVVVTTPNAPPPSSSPAPPPSSDAPPPTSNAPPPTSAAPPPSSDAPAPTTAPVTSAPASESAPAPTTAPEDSDDDSTAAGGSSVTRVGGGGGTTRGRSTSLVLQTVTLPDGAQSTLTAVSVVGGGTEVGDAGAQPTDAAGPSASGSLQQSGGVGGRSMRWGGALVTLLGGAVGVALLL